MFGFLSNKEKKPFHFYDHVNDIIKLSINSTSLSEDQLDYLIESILSYKDMFKKEYPKARDNILLMIGEEYRRPSSYVKLIAYDKITENLFNTNYDSFIYTIYVIYISGCLFVLETDQKDLEMLLQIIRNDSRIDKNSSEYTQILNTINNLVHNWRKQL